MKISDGILETLRGIHTYSEIKFAPEGTTAADLFGEYEGERKIGDAKELDIANIKLDDLY